MPGPGPDGRLKAFLERGFFPIELPPPFVSHTFARQRARIDRELPKKLEGYSTQFEPYGFPRFDGNRRRLAIVNPIPYFRVSKLLSENWTELRQHLKRSKLSVFKPVFDTKGPRTFVGVDFDLVRSREHEILGRFDGCIKADIARFYPSIYTHSIPWALLGKSRCKAVMTTKAFKSSYANQLDVFVRNMQDRQTTGVPVGPETSRILAELISAAIDAKLQDDLKLSAKNALRFVDDYAIAIRPDLNEARIKHAFSRALAEYELELNFTKTKLMGVGKESAPSWVGELASFRLSRTRQRRSLDQYFERAFRLADEFSADHVLRYAIRKASSFSVNDNEWPHFQLLLQQAVRRSGGSLIQDFVSLLVNANFRSRPVDKTEAQEFMQSVVERGAPLQNAHEVAWCLFLAKGLRLPISAGACKSVLAMESAACSLILVDLFNRGQVSFRVNASIWKKSLNSDGLRSPLWLLVYELHRKNWLGLTGRGSFVESDLHFGPLLNAGVFFYDEARNVPVLEKQKRNLRNQKQRIQFIFQHLDDYF